MSIDAVTKTSALMIPKTTTKSTESITTTTTKPTMATKPAIETTTTAKATTESKKRADKRGRPASASTATTKPKPPRKKAKTAAEAAEHLRQKKAIAARLSNATLPEKLSSMSAKERMLGDRVHRIFAELGPNALASMQIGVKIGAREPDNRGPLTFNTTENQSITIPQPNPSEEPAWLKTALADVPTLRAFERFMQRVAETDGAAAYFRLVPLPAGQTLVPAAVCRNDPYFRNDIGVYPVHIFAGQKRMIAVHQRKYVDANGRRVPLFGWPFPTTVCQANCFAWLIGDGILQRFTDIGAPPPIRPRPKKRPPKATVGRPKSNADANSKKLARLAGRSDLYQYNFVSYIPRPADEGAATADPTTQLPAFEASRDAVRRYYETALSKLIYVSRNRDEPASNWLEMEPLDWLPILVPTTAAVDIDDDGYGNDTDIPAEVTGIWRPVCNGSSVGCNWSIRPATADPEPATIDDGLEFWIGVRRPYVPRSIPSRPVPDETDNDESTKAARRRKRKRQRPAEPIATTTAAATDEPTDDGKPKPTEWHPTPPTLFICGTDGLPLFLTSTTGKPTTAVYNKPVSSVVHPQPRRYFTAAAVDIRPPRMSVLDAVDESDILPDDGGLIVD